MINTSDTSSLPNIRFFFVSVIDQVFYRTASKDHASSKASIFFTAETGPGDYCHFDFDKIKNRGR